MRTLLNVIWHFPFLGFLCAIGYFLLGLLLCCTIILIPLGVGYMQLASFLLHPYSSRMVSRYDLALARGESLNPASEVYSMIIRILFFPIGLLASIFTIALIVGEAFTIIGIPCAVVWAKSLSTIFNPVYKVCVPVSVAEHIDRVKMGIAQPSR